MAHHPQEVRPHPVERLQRGEVLQGDHHRLDRAILGVDRGRIDQSGNASPVRVREHQLLGAHRLRAAQLLGQREAVERDLAPVGEAAGHLLQQVLGRAAGSTQGFEHAPRLAVDRDQTAEPGIEHQDAEGRSLDQRLEVGAGALLGAVGPRIGDRGRGLSCEEQQDFFVLVGELGPALLVSEEEVADLDAEMAQRRAHAGARRHSVPGRAEGTGEGPEVRDPEGARQMAELFEQLRSVRPLLDPAVLVVGQARGDEGVGRSRLVDGDDAAVARVGEHAGAPDHLAQDGFEVEA